MAKNNYVKLIRQEQINSNFRGASVLMIYGGIAGGIVGSLAGEEDRAYYFIFRNVDDPYLPLPDYTTQKDVNFYDRMLQTSQYKNNKGEKVKIIAIYEGLDTNFIEQFDKKLLAARGIDELEVLCCIINRNEFIS